MTSTSTSIALRQPTSQRGLLSATAYLRNRWLQQDEILARIACPWRIRKLRRDRHLEQPAAMVLPNVASKDSTGGRRLARSL
jgi:hypothetical protein